MYLQQILLLFSSLIYLKQNNCVFQLEQAFCALLLYTPPPLH